MTPSGHPGLQPLLQPPSLQPPLLPFLLFLTLFPWIVLKQFFASKFGPQKNASGDPVGAQSDSKVAPKRPQNGDWGVHFGDFSCNRAILHPICYLLCFYHILQVSSGPFCDSFPEKMSAGHRPPAKSFSVSFFCDFYAKRCPNGVPNGGGTAP